MDDIVFCSECGKPLSEEEIFVLENQGVKISPTDVVCFMGEDNCQNKLMIAKLESKYATKR